ncbi:hypothetical protein NQ314_016467 [Rhamnusium bicolor]|uniref:Uncharacterized protein n=1 Tax=Rhamnusium bicolor TaxID=1586634 RepID=A0AAV8WWZ7_9CUCU|nr:hypothetical protein NQ314_016467 [Rhamnusium bicolor]
MYNTETACEVSDLSKILLGLSRTSKAASKIDPCVSALSPTITSTFSFTSPQNSLLLPSSISLSVFILSTSTTSNWEGDDCSISFCKSSLLIKAGRIFFGLGLTFAFFDRHSKDSVFDILDFLEAITCFLGAVSLVFIKPDTWRTIAV